MSIDIRINQLWVGIAAMFFFSMAMPISAAEDEHEEEEHEEDGVSLTAAERNEAGIEIFTMERRAVNRRLRVPGEVQANAYKSAKIAPRITAQVVSRHVKLGEHVAEGQKLVTLISVEMADAQGDLIVADQEWKRVQSLGAEVLSGRRYTEAEVNRQRAMAKVLAYGMSKNQVSKFVKANDASLATGEFAVVAPLGGTVLGEDFVIGELIEPGHVLYEISDESTLWIEARVSAGKMAGISGDVSVEISADQVDWHDAKVVQVNHRLNEVTRTQAVRIEFNNDNDAFHPGQFVEVKIAVGESQDLLAIPSEAAVLLKGNTVVFLAEDNDEFHPQPVTLGDTFGGEREVLSGLEEGDVIVTSGAFF